MKQNVLKFQSDIKAQVAKQKENGSCDWWMHPVYCAYYILRHNVNPEEHMNLDIQRSYKALLDYWKKEYFKKVVREYLDKYAETVCAN